MLEPSQPISRVRVVFNDPTAQVDDFVGHPVGKYGTTRGPLFQALIDGRKSVVAAINDAYNFVDEPLAPEMMQAEAYFDRQKTTLCVVVEPFQSDRDNVKQRLDGRRVQSQPSNGQVMQMLATLQGELSQLEKARASDQIAIMKLQDANEGVKEKNIQLEGALGKLQDANEGVKEKNIQLEGALGKLQDANEGVKEKNIRLEGALGKLRDERASDRADIARLDEERESFQELLERSENEITALKADLSEVKSELKNAIDDLCRTTSMLMPLHLRVLLDLARKKVIQLLDIESWDNLQQSRSTPQLARYIEAELKRRNVTYTLSLDALTYLCSYNNVRREGNKAAHRASHAEIRQAVMGSPIEYQNRHFLEEVYEFRFEMSVYEDTRNEQMTC